MNPVHQEVLIITPSLLLASYGAMRLIVLLRDYGKAREERSTRYTRVFIWGLAMSLLSLITLFATAKTVGYLTGWFLFYYSFSSPFFALFFLFIGSTVDQEYSATKKAPKERDSGFYVAVLAELLVIPLLTLLFCDSLSFNTLRARLGWMPVGFALSSFLLNVTVSASNRNCHLDAHSPWARFAMIYSSVVAFAYPICHSFAVALDDKGRVDDDMLWFWSIFSTILVGFLAFISTKAFYLRMDGAPWKLVKNEMPSFESTGDYHPPRDRYYDQTPMGKPMDLYRSSYEEPDPYREEIYRQYDASRRVSEDIQQFHNEHPDADLTDHYSWEDILDAETDGYLDEDDSF